MPLPGQPELVDDAILPISPRLDDERNLTEPPWLKYTTALQKRRMGSGPELTQTSLETLQEALQTERITYVDTLNEDIGAVVESADQLAFDYVVGDVSDYGVSSNDHVHLDLVHEGSTIHCVLFGYKRSASTLRSRMGCRSRRPQIASKRGNVSVIVEDIVEIRMTESTAVYEQNRNCDSDEVIDQHKEGYSRYEGLIWSNQCNNRSHPITSIHIQCAVNIVFPNTSVQGDDAMMSIMGAITELEDDPRVDVIVSVAAAVRQASPDVRRTPLAVSSTHRAPVVVGVGHENDRTLADEVADRPVMTPTEAGNIVPERTTLEAGRYSQSAHRRQGYRDDAGRGRTDSHVPQTDS